MLPSTEQCGQFPHADFPLTNLDSDHTLSGILAIYLQMSIRETRGYPEVISLALMPPLRSWTQEQTGILNHHLL